MPPRKEVKKMLNEWKIIKESKDKSGEVILTIVLETALTKEEAVEIAQDYYESMCEYDKKSNSVIAVLEDVVGNWDDWEEIKQFIQEINYTGGRVLPCPKGGKTMDKMKTVRQIQVEYLEALTENGTVKIEEAIELLAEEFNIKIDEARAIVKEWKK